MAATMAVTTALTMSIWATSTFRTVTREMAHVSISLQMVREVWVDARPNTSREPTMALTWHPWMTEDWAVACLQETHRQPRLNNSTVTQKDSLPWAAASHLEEFSKRRVPILLSSNTTRSSNPEVYHLAQVCKLATQVRTTLSVTEGNTLLHTKETIVGMHTKETIADRAGIEQDKKRAYSQDVFADANWVSESYRPTKNQSNATHHKATS